MENIKERRARSFLLFFKIEGNWTDGHRWVTVNLYSAYIHPNTAPNLKKGITMSNFEIENNVKSSENVDNHARLGQSIHGQLSTEDFKNLLPKRVQPDVCIRDEDGYIACGPIVGIERPDSPIFKPSFDKPRFDKPNMIEKFPSNRIDKVSPADLLEQEKGFDSVIQNKRN